MNGVLPDSDIRDLINQGVIRADAHLRKTSLQARKPTP